MGPNDPDRTEPDPSTEGLTEGPGRTATIAESTDEERIDDSLLRAVAFVPERTLDAAGDPPRSDVFEGTDRYRIEQRLGQGAFGVVYRVYDRRRGISVALKRLRRADPRWLLRFKSEFRALAGVVHPNLVTLYDLESSTDHTFFTMELCDGSDFLSHVREGNADGSRIQRLRAGLVQLVAGVAFLHEQGKVHCDLKPSNVLVDRGGRVVVLDFGLVVDATADEPHLAKHLAGTPAYMAPEQARGERATPASDWYAVGVMIYEALTDELPFSGSTDDMLESKRSIEAPLLRERAPNAPADLADLCATLLERDAARRPNAEEIARRILGQPLPRTPARPRDARFFGRITELAALRSAYERARAGTCTWALLHGSSGMGKSALLARFLDSLRASSDPNPAASQPPQAEVVVLSGRCYEREAVPYKALDAVIDALSRHLRALPPTVAARLWPEPSNALAELFPALAAANGVPRLRTAPKDARERLLAGVAELRSLLGRLCRERPVVVAIDDLQWGDLDSADLLTAVIDGPDAPPILLITSHRREESSSSPVLLALEAWRTRAADRFTCIDVPVDAMSEADARSLAHARIGASEGAAPLADAIAKEASGNPFLIDELCRVGLGDLANEVEESIVRLDRVLARRIRALPTDARSLVEALAVAARPLPAALAFRVAAMDRVDPGVLARLRAERVIRARTRGDEETFECYHDRIRVATTVSLTRDARRDRHLALARAFETDTNGAHDPEEIGAHYREGGEPLRAARFFETAAERASKALAFDRAARLIGEAMALAPERSRDELASLWARRGDAYANAGRGADAAAAYAQAAAHSSASRANDLRRSVAEQLWRGGRIGEGVEAARAVLRDCGMSWPRSTPLLLLGLLVRRARLWWSLRRFLRRPPREPKDDAAFVIDAGYFFGNFLSGLTPIAGLSLHAATLLRAIQAGDTPRIGRSLAIEAFLSAHRPSREPRSRLLLAKAHALTADAPPLLRVQTLAGHASLATNVASFEEALAIADEAERLYVERCVGHWSEATLVRFLRQVALFYLGRWGETAHIYERHRHDCEQRDDLLFACIGAAHFGWIAPLLADDSAGARRVAESVDVLESRVGFPLAHSSALMVRAWADRYDGDGVAALESLDALWPKLRAQGVRFVAVAELRFRLERASAALLACGQEGAPAAARAHALRVARADTARIARLGLRPCEAMTLLLRAGIAGCAGDISLATSLLKRASPELRALGLMAHANAADRRRGELTGGAAGEALRRSADTFFESQSARRPDKLAAMLAPLGAPLR
jgi:serine/threonine protein kinase/tetratricopeptide (TPR) repeat protein